SLTGVDRLGTHGYRSPRSRTGWWRNRLGGGAGDMMSRSRTGWLVWPLACLAIVGCHSPLFRGQSPDAQLAVVEESGTTLVGDLTLASGMNPIEINGVGLVTGLDNTGSAPAPSPERDALLDEMQTHNVDQPQTVLDSKRTALV